MVTPSRGVDARLVVGLGLAALGIILSIAIFQSRPQGPQPVGTGDDTSPALGLLVGSIAVIGLVLLAYWSRARWGKQIARDAGKEAAAAIRATSPPARASTCPACQRANAADARICDQCGARLAA